jgi:hypothetical protein
MKFSGPYPEEHESGPHPSYFFRTHFNIIVQSRPTSSKWSLSFSVFYYHKALIFVLSHSFFILSFLKYKVRSINYKPPHDAFLPTVTSAILRSTRSSVLKHCSVGFKILTALVTLSSVFWDVMTFISINQSTLWRNTYLFHLQDWRVSEEINSIRIHKLSHAW